MTIEAGRENPADLVPASIFSASVRALSTGLLILITLIAFEAIAVTAALPTAARDLHGLAAFGWAFTGFLIASVVGMVASGGLSDTRGPRFPLTAGMALFLGGLLVSGTATTMAQLVAGRIVQGLGGGLLITAVYVVIGEAYPAALRPKVFTATASAWVVPSAIGPVIAGTLVQHVNWRWVFLGLVPLVVLGGVLMLPAMRALPSGNADATRRRADLRRLGIAVVVAAGIASLENAGQRPDTVLAWLAVPGLVALAWGLRVLLPAGTFTVRPGVSAPIALRGVCSGAFFGMEAIIPLALSIQHHYSATLAALPLTCAGLSWSAGSWWQGRAHRSGDLAYRRTLVRTGFGFIAIAAGLLALGVQPALPGWLVYVSWLFAGSGAGLTMSSVGVLMLDFTADAERGANSAALQLSDATSDAVTTGIAGVLVAAAARAVIGYTAAFTLLSVAMGAIALIGAATAGRLRPTRALTPPP